MADYPKPRHITRDELLVEAETLINGDRAETYGSAAENFARVAALWTVVLGTPVTATQVGLCLLELKVARAITAPNHRDSYVDAAGYIALTGEIALNED
ncbi:DUF6378 domain-containing protein [Timonella senegalensis]|uniref:DUF6378 domain-containing protein n=1 Tax=Timonella senegalensis TaxID=1465825 RepID=UPI000313C092|nr:DUF6378 domain-containing protein [Timonella senegalensis]